MIFHLSVETKKENTDLTFDDSTPVLNQEEIKIVRRQIRKNSVVIHDYMSRIHLIVNQEKHAKDEKFVEELRKRMFLLMDENDTFRQVLWRHLSLARINVPGNPLIQEY